MSVSDEKDEGLTDAVKASIRKEAAGQVAKWTIAAFVLLFGVAASGWWFYLENKLDSYIAGKVKSVPPQAVMAFDSSDGCPDGWVAFKDAESRFIIGAGKGENLSSRPFRTRNDVEAVTLTENNIPLHQHDTMIGVTQPGLWGAGPPKSAVAGASMGTFLTALSSPYGKAQPDNLSVMPPFIALTVCKKS